MKIKHLSSGNTKKKIVFAHKTSLIRTTKFNFFHFVDSFFYDL